MIANPLHDVARADVHADSPALGRGEESAGQPSPVERGPVDHGDSYILRAP